MFEQKSGLEQAKIGPKTRKISDFYGKKISKVHKLKSPKVEHPETKSSLHFTSPATFCRRREKVLQLLIVHFQLSPKVGEIKFKILTSF